MCVHVCVQDDQGTLWNGPIFSFLAFHFSQWNGYSINSPIRLFICSESVCLCKQKLF